VKAARKGGFHFPKTAQTLDFKPLSGLTSFSNGSRAGLETTSKITQKWPGSTKPAPSLKNCDTPLQTADTFMPSGNSGQKKATPPQQDNLAPGVDHTTSGAFFISGQLFPLERNLAIPAYYVDLPRGADTRAAFRADVFDTAVLGFAAAFLSAAVAFRQAGRADRIAAQSLLQPRAGFRGEGGYRPAVFVVLLND
jgi:hypothetical protein